MKEVEAEKRVEQAPLMKEDGYATCEQYRAAKEQRRIHSENSQSIISNGCDAAESAMNLALKTQDPKLTTRPQGNPMRMVHCLQVEVGSL